MKSHSSPVRLRAPHRAGAILALALSCSFAFACSSNPIARSETPVDLDALSPDELAAVEVVERLQAAMIAIMQAASELGYAGRYASIEKIVRQSFDIPVMARASFGPGFGDLTPEQQRSWIEIYGRFHISSMADVRDKYSGQVYMIFDASEAGPDGVMVYSKLDYPGRNVDLYTDHRLRQTPDGWRIVDVHDPPSVSRVAMHRAEYRTVLDRRGFDGLIEEMESRIRRRERP